jgi:O-antigen ligase
MRRASAFFLLAVIAMSIAVTWVPAKWPGSISETGIFLLAASWSCIFAARRKSPRFNLLLAPLTGVVVWALFQLSMRATVYPHLTWLSALYWTAHVATVFASLQIFTDATVRKQFLRWLLLFGFAVSILSTVQALTKATKIFWTFPTEYAGWTLMGSFVYHNQFAAFIELLLPIALYNALTEREWRAFDLVIAATMYASVIVAASRAGFALATAEFVGVPLVLFWLGKITIRQISAFAVMLTGLISILALAAGPEILATRFAMRDPYAVRREFLYSSVRMFRDKPLIGVGLGNWATAYPAYALYDDGTYANQAHNDWAQWAVEGGLPLFALQLWLAWLIVPNAIRSGWGMGIAAVFVHCLVDYPIQRPPVALIFFALIGAVAVDDAATHAIANRNMRSTVSLATANLRRYTAVLFITNVVD